MTKLSVNVNKLALLRNSRAKDNPNVTAWAKRILEWGSHGLTVHPRPDERHIHRKDAVDLAKLVKSWNQTTSRRVEYNIEGYPSPEYVALIAQTRPDQCTLVPDPPDALTSNSGWDFIEHRNFLIEIVRELKTSGARVSLFLEPAKFTAKQAQALGSIACDRVELYTEAYAEGFAEGVGPQALASYRKCADQVLGLGLGINAGHDLNQKNLGPLIDSIPEIAEVSIGHALICEALQDGLEATVRTYLEILREIGSAN